MKKIPFVSFLVVLISFGHTKAVPSNEAASFIKKAHELHLAEDPTWQHLLHLETNIFWMKRSAIDDHSFFLSPRGQADPQAELDATLENFLSPSPVTDESSVCRYPARRS